MIIYVKENFSKGEESYYFTDGENKMSKDYSFRAMITHAKFLDSLGIELKSNYVDLSHYMNGGTQ